MKKALTKTLTAVALAFGLSGAALADKPTLKIGYINSWDDSVAVSFVAAEILREKLGYPVELKPVEPALMWQGVARGDLDISLSAWMPVTHGEYSAKLGDKVEILGSNYVDAKIGLVIPDYVEGVNSIEDLNAHAKDFNGVITGIDAGAGIMRRTEDAIKEYGLTLKLMPSSGSGMATALDRAIRTKKAVVVTGWIPHWMFARWQLRFLDDPKGVYGKAEHIDTFVNLSLAQKAPEAHAFLKKLSWGAADVGAVMLTITEGAKPEQAAKDWVGKNQDKVALWLQQ